MFTRQRYLVNSLFNISRSSQCFEKWNTGHRLVSSASYTRTEVTIPVPIRGGHLAAQLWQSQGSGSSSSNTPIICMHGFQDNSSSFDPLIPLILKDNMTIVSVDQPGHGLSSQLAGQGYDILLDGLGTIHRVMRHFNWEKVTLMGHSYGSILSFVFAATHVPEVERYIAIDVLHPIDRDITWHIERTIKALFDIEKKLTDPNKVQPSYTFEDMVQRTLKGRKGTVTEESVKILLRRGAVPDPDNPGLFKFSHDLKTNIPSMFVRASHPESLRVAERIKCPVCVIKGDPGEDYGPREKFMEMVDAVKKANGGKLSFHLVPGTHHLHLNDPHIVAPIISNFLQTDF